ncbi:chorismate--pyruvate lyase family protein [Wohlfahrtiimonas populi]|uniref:chorismate--pyruvate lyase family protein n=1 Tax=Wohlfahrtiimonas populi TaxID=1940240 RepID=UPI00098D2DC4|nr:chorismate lyase [Wohlfahrtiimonas populi]
MNNGWYDAIHLTELLEEHEYNISQYQPLLEVQSLTQGLEKLNPNFSVELLNLAEISAPNYANILPESTQHYFSRRVILKLDDQPVIWAESLCDIQSDFWREYLNCGTQSLGRKLFSGDEIERTPFFYKAFSVEELPFDLLSDYLNMKFLIARQSVFTYKNEKLCLTEWYLPNLRQFLAN